MKTSWDVFAVATILSFLIQVGPVAAQIPSAPASAAAPSSPAPTIAQAANSQPASVADPEALTPFGDTLTPLPPVSAPDMDYRVRSLELRLEEQQAVTENLERRLNAQAPIAPVAPPSTVIPESKPYVIGSLLSMQPVWNNGLEFYSQHRDFYFHIGGRTQMDFTALNSPDGTAALTNTQQTPNDGLQDAVDFRRGRLRAEGQMYEQYDWCVEYNFVNSVLIQSPSATAPQTPNGNYPNNGTGTRNLVNSVANVPSPTDLWWNFRELPYLNNVTIGNQKDAFGLEHLQSSRYLDFMERNYGQDAFISPANNGFAPGIATWNWSEDKRSAYNIGVYKNVYDSYAFDIGDSGYEIAARGTHCLYYDQPSNGRYLWHVGLGACCRSIGQQEIRYRSRGALWNGESAVLPIYADTGYLTGHTQDMIVPETIVQWGSFYLQSEFQANWTTSAVTIPGEFQGGGGSAGATPIAQGNLFFYSYYATVGYFLTGESKTYDYQKGLIGRIVPNENAFLVRGRDGLAFGHGGLQVLGRFQQLNLNDKQVRGGRLTDYTIGLNWFLNPNMKIQFNVDNMWREAGGVGAGGGTHGYIYGFGSRFAADF